MATKKTVKPAGKATKPRAPRVSKPKGPTLMQQLHVLAFGANSANGAVMEISAFLNTLTGKDINRFQPAIALLNSGHSNGEKIELLRQLLSEDKLK